MPKVVQTRRFGATQRYEQGLSRRGSEIHEWPYNVLRYNHTTILFYCYLKVVPMQNIVLVVDDDPAIVEFVGDALRDDGYGVVTATNGVAALIAVRQYHPHVVILDMRMP